MCNLYELYINGLYNMFVNGLDVKSINFFPWDECGLHKCFATGLKRLSVNACSCDIIESVGIRPATYRNGMNGLGTKLDVNGPNFLNGLGP